LTGGLFQVERKLFASSSSAWFRFNGGGVVRALHYKESFCWIQVRKNTLLIHILLLKMLCWQI